MHGTMSLKLGILCSICPILTRRKFSGMYPWHKTRPACIKIHRKILILITHFLQVKYPEKWFLKIQSPYMARVKYLWVNVLPVTITKSVISLLKRMVPFNTIFRNKITWKKNCLWFPHSTILVSNKFV